MIVVITPPHRVPELAIRLVVNPSKPASKQAGRRTPGDLSVRLGRGDAPRTCRVCTSATYERRANERPTLCLCPRVAAAGPKLDGESAKPKRTYAAPGSFDGSLGVPYARRFQTRPSAWLQSTSRSGSGPGATGPRAVRDEEDNAWRWGGHDGSSRRLGSGPAGTAHAWRDELQPGRTQRE